MVSTCTTPAGTCRVLTGVPRSRSHHAAPTVGCPAKGSSVAGVKMCAMRGVRAGRGHVDEYRFAVTQFGGEPLPVGRGPPGWRRRRRGDCRSCRPESVKTRSTVTSMAMSRCYVVAAAWATQAQVALRSSAPIASSTATRVSTDPVIVALADAGAQQVAQQLLVVVGGLGGVDELLDDFDEAVRVVVEREVAGALEDLELRAGHRGVRHLGVTHRDHRIAASPKSVARERIRSNNIGRAW